MRRILVTGLESSVTRVVASIIANNLELPLEKFKDKNEFCVQNEYCSVTHCSMPHGYSDIRSNNMVDLNLYPSVEESDWDNIIVCTRDYNCVLQSRLKNHQPDEHIAISEQNIGIYFLSKILLLDNCSIFSYETWRIFKDVYLQKFLSGIDIPHTILEKVFDVNEKYLK